MDMDSFVVFYIAVSWYLFILFLPKERRGGAGNGNEREGKERKHRKQKGKKRSRERRGTWEGVKNGMCVPRCENALLETIYWHIDLPCKISLPLGLPTQKSWHRHWLLRYLLGCYRRQICTSSQKSQQGQARQIYNNWHLLECRGNFVAYLLPVVYIRSTLSPGFDCSWLQLILCKMSCFC